MTRHSGILQLEGEQFLACSKEDPQDAELLANWVSIVIER